MNIDRENLSAYSRMVFDLTTDELSKEIWLLEEHVRHLKATQDDQSKIDRFSQMIRVARQEKDRRAFDKGYI